MSKYDEQGYVSILDSYGTRGKVIKELKTKEENEGKPVLLVAHEGKRYLVCFNESGCNHTKVDIDSIIKEL